MKLTATHHVLYMDIIAKLELAKGQPVEVHNPKTADLIAIGELVEAAPRITRTIGGLSVITFTVTTGGR